MANRDRSRGCYLLISSVILLTFCAITFVLWLGARSVLTGGMSAGQLGQFVLYAASAAGSAAGLSEIWGQVQRAAGAMERLAELLDARPAIVSPAVPRPLPPGPLSVSFEKVCFAYPTRPEEQVLRHLSFTIKVGATVAMVGPSGADRKSVGQAKCV